MIDAPEGELNIKDFVIEGPKKERVLSFDPEKDISGETWNKLLDEFRREKIHLSINPDQAASTLNMAADIKLLHHGENIDGMPQFSDSEWEVIDRAIVKLKDKDDPGNYLWLLKGVQLFDPERAKNSKYKPDPEVLSKLESNIGKFDALRYFHTTATLKILNPSYNVAIPEHRWEELHQSIIAHDTIPLIQREANLKHLIPAIASAKMLDPEKVENIYPLSNQRWNDLKKSLQYIADSEAGFKWLYYASFAKSLLMLSAEKINVTESGLELVMPSPKAELHTAPAIPEVRNF